MSGGHSATCGAARVRKGCGSTGWLLACLVCARGCVCKQASGSAGGKQSRAESVGAPALSLRVTGVTCSCWSCVSLLLAIDLTNH